MSAIPGEDTDRTPAAAALDAAAVYALVRVRLALTLDEPAGAYSDAALLGLAGCLRGALRRVEDELAGRGGVDVGEIGPVALRSISDAAHASFGGCRRDLSRVLRDIRVSADRALEDIYAAEDAAVEDPLALRPAEAVGEDMT